MMLVLVFKPSSKKMNIAVIIPSRYGAASKQLKGQDALGLVRPIAAGAGVCQLRRACLTQGPDRHGSKVVPATKASGLPSAALVQFSSSGPDLEGSSQPAPRYRHRRRASTHTSWISQHASHLRPDTTP